MKPIARSIVVPILFLAGLYANTAFPQVLPTGEPSKAVALAKEYLRTGDVDRRRSLAQQLAAFDAQWEEVLQGLHSRPQQTMGPGYHAAEHFSVPELREEHPDDLLYFLVPATRQGARPWGLVIFMHGGGKGSPRTAPARYMRPHNPTEAYIGDVFEQVGLIGVAPSAPWNENDHSRWTLAEADKYLADVVLECKARFPIDPDRVFLWGHSMGGFGAYHQVQRQPDRFAAVIASAGSWTLAQWPVVRGTVFCIVHGTRDAELGVRDRHTDIAYARWAHRLLSSKNIPHVYLEHDGPHPVRFSKPGVLEFFRRNPNLRRDAYAPHIVLASPVGYAEKKCFPVRHNRWLTLNAAVDGPLSYDALQSNGIGASKDSTAELWNRWELRHHTLCRTGAMIEAVHCGGNRFEITTRNVVRFTVWLHPKMVDFARPIQIVVNGRSCFCGRVQPSLAVALDSFRRRGDWGLVYPARVELEGF